MKSLQWLRLLAFCLVLPTAALATSETYPLELKQSVCTSSDGVKVCRHTSLGASAVLTVDYFGSMSRFDPVSVWIKLNGRAGTYRMNRTNNHSTLFITNGAIECSLCSSQPRPDMIPCPGPWFTDHWLCTDAPKNMKDLFVSASNDDGSPAVWEIELAFVSGNEWDSLNGLNYRFRLP